MKKCSTLFFAMYHILIFSQGKDVHTYSVAVHQKARYGSAYVTNNLIIKEEDKLPQISILVRNFRMDKIPKSSIELSLAKNDSLVEMVLLGSGGVYSFDNLRPGIYNVKVSAKGYVSNKMLAVSLDSTQSVPLIFKLGRPDSLLRMTINSDKELSDKTLKKRIREFEKQHNE